MQSLPGVRELVRLRARDGDHHLALTHWILSSKSFAVKTLQKDEVHHQQMCLLLAASFAYSVCFNFTSMPNSVTWRTTMGFLRLCPTSCLSWSTAIRWTPGLRRRGKVETSSMHSTAAAWKTFTRSFTMGCTATSTRLVQLNPGFISCLAKNDSVFFVVSMWPHKTSWSCSDVWTQKLSRSGVFPSQCMRAELRVWRGDVPHQWPQHGCPLQPAQQRLAGKSSGSTAELRGHVWSHRSPGC